MEVRRMAIWFSKPSKNGGGLRYPVETVHRLIGKNRLSGRLFDYLQARNYVTTEKSEFLVKLPVTTAAIFRNDLLDPEYDTFLNDYSEWKSKR
jgi:hypothetical protein